MHYNQLIFSIILQFADHNVILQVFLATCVCTIFFKIPIVLETTYYARI